MEGIETSVTCRHKAKGTREVQTRKAVLVSPACHLLFRHQHVVAFLFPAVTLRTRRMPSRDTLDEEASTQELPSCFEEMFGQLFPTTPQEARAEGSSPTRAQSYWGTPQNLQHLLASRRGSFLTRQHLQSTQDSPLIRLRRSDSCQR